MPTVELKTIDNEHILTYNFGNDKTECEVHELNEKCDKIFMSFFLGREYTGKAISTGREHTIRFRNTAIGVALAAAQDIAYLLKADFNLL